MPEFTIERRSFLLGAVLAPFAGRFAAAGVEPKLAHSEFVICLSGGHDQFHISLSESADVEGVMHVSDESAFRMTEAYLSAMGDLRGNRWRTFEHNHDSHRASIRFLVRDENTIEVDYVGAYKQLEPLVVIKDSAATPAVELDWIGFGKK